jgi:hypothetical protein
MPLLLLVALSARAGQIEPLDLAAIRDRSPLVVIGYVTRVRTTRNNNAGIEKVATVRVATVLRGAWREQTLTIRTRTGLLFFDRHFDEGDAGVFFLQPAGNGQFEAAYPGAFAMFERGTVKTP